MRAQQMHEQQGYKRATQRMDNGEVIEDVEFKDETRQKYALHRSFICAARRELAEPTVRFVRVREYAHAIHFSHLSPHEPRIGQIAVRGVKKTEPAFQVCEQFARRGRHLARRRASQRLSLMITLFATCSGSNDSDNPP